MRDYTQETLKKTNPALYVQKMLTYDIWHGKKIEKSMVRRYINKISLPPHIHEFIHFLLNDEKNHSHTKATTRA